MRLDHHSDVCGVGEVKSSVDFVQNVEWCWFELEHGQDQRQSYERTLTSRELVKTLLDDAVEGNSHFETITNSFAFWRNEFCVGIWQKAIEDFSKVLKTKVFVDFLQ